ncbi:FAD-dependent oxidoreductase [Aspergillus undulatus]|uniref:FAD-dependent oxidoreductase n=1 Tax=Aspergillus undulatus TaxID=1810928 RepID=UPI003CCD9027
MTVHDQPSISIAIIGGGPGGLGTAIALSELPFVSVKLYEQAPKPREVGAGSSIGRNAWNVLNLLGAAEGIRGGKLGYSWQRNGRTCEPVNLDSDSSEALADEQAEEDPRYAAIRARRTRLQAALLEKVPAGTIQFGKNVVSMRDLGADQGVWLGFRDGTDTTADYVVGADGIRSGTLAFPVLIPISSIDHIKDIPTSNGWWHGLNSHLYFARVDDESEKEPQLCEITIRSYNEPVTPDRAATWAIPATNERLSLDFGHAQEYNPRIQELLKAVPEGTRREFAMVAGPCLQEITAWGKVALIGDASHPLSGAFGSGAAFAMEDGWILARTLELEHSRNPIT